MLIFFALFKVLWYLWFTC